MAGRIKNIDTWRKHLPQRPRRMPGAYYRQSRAKRYKKVIISIWLILFLFLVQSIFQARIFKVDKIRLINNKDLTQEEVSSALTDSLAKTRWLIFKNDNYFLLKTKPLEELLVNDYNLDEAKVDKKFPDTLKITVKEKASYFMWQKNNTLYLLDAKGFLNRQIEAPDPKYLLLEDRREWQPSSDEIFSREEVDKINQIYLKWPELIADRLILNKIVINNDWTLDLYTNLGFYVKMDAKEDMVVQIENLARVLKAGTISGGDINYIDVRFGDKVYFK